MYLPRGSTSTTTRANAHSRKRPLGLFKQRSPGATPSAQPQHPNTKHITQTSQYALPHKRQKRSPSPRTQYPQPNTRSSSFFNLSTAPIPPSDYDHTGTALRQWEALKALFYKGSKLCECHKISEALPLLRQVIHECQRLMARYPDPSVIYSFPSAESRRSSPSDDNSPIIANPSVEAVVLGQSDVYRSDTCEVPTAFHTIFGIALFLVGNILIAHPNLSLPDDPPASSFCLAALDVFETGETLPCLVDGKGDHVASNDWQMALCWGRTLVCLSEQKLSSPPGQSNIYSPNPFKTEPSWSHAAYPSPFPIAEPQCSSSPLFQVIGQNRPPVTRRMSLYSASPHDILLLAMDQFSRGIFRMPRVRPTHPPEDVPMTDAPQYPFPEHVHQTPSPDIDSSPCHYPNIAHPVYCHTHNSTTALFCRSKELYTIASEVLSVTERLTSNASRQFWASWVDATLNQMELEADSEKWSGAIAEAKGKCWLIIGQAMSDVLDDPISDDHYGALSTDEAEEAREGLTLAITFLERAYKSKGCGSQNLMTEGHSLSLLISKAYAALAHLTINEDDQQALLHRSTLAADLSPPPPPSSFDLQTELSIKMRL